MSKNPARIRAAYLGHLTRLYNEAEALRSNGKVKDVLQKVKDVEATFLSFSQAHLEYYNSLEENERENANKYFNDHLQNKLRFVLSMKNWARENVRREDTLSSVTSSRSTRSKSSNASSAALKRLRAKEALAEMEMQQLKFRQDLLRQEEEMKLQRQLLEAQYKVERAKLEVKIYSEDLEDDNGELLSIDNYDQDGMLNPVDGEEFNDLKQKTLQELNQRLNDFQFEDINLDSSLQNIEQNPIDDLVKSERANDLEQRHCFELPNATSRNAEHKLFGQSKVNCTSKDNENKKQLNANSNPDLHSSGKHDYGEELRSLSHAINLPRPKLHAFSGDPLEYWSFIHLFDNFIVKNTTTDSERLMYLLQFTTGEANKLVKCCTMMNPCEGYKSARDILKERFGHPFTIASKCISKLTDGPPIKSSDHAGLRAFADELSECQTILESIGYLQEINSADNLRRIVQRLPISLRHAFIETADSLQQQGERPSIRHVAQFVTRKARAINDPVFGSLIDAVPSNVKVNNQGQRLQPKPKPEAVRHNQFSTSIAKETSPAQACPVCKQQHHITSCCQFKAMSYEDRVKFMRSSNMCNNCFKPGHIALGCLEVKSCEVDGCTRRHHTMLHPPSRNTQQTKQEHSLPKVTASNQVQNHAQSSPDQRVCLRILPVEVQGPSKSVTTYALLDSGSDVSLCAQDLASDLGIQGELKPFFLTTQEKKDSVKVGQHISNLNVKSLDGANILTIDKIWTVNRLNVSSNSIPSKTEVDLWSHLDDVNLTDVQDKEVKMIIGGNVPEAFWVLDERRGNPGEPYAIRSPLGWTLLGPTSIKTDEPHYSTAFITLEDEKDDDRLMKQVQQFWNTDHVAEPPQSVKMSLEDKSALKTMSSSAQLVDGHYQIGLPWKQEIPYLPNNRSLAEQRLKLLRRRLLSDEELYLKYKTTIDDYVSKGHAVQVPEAEIVVDDKPLWYLPHHPVFNPNKPGKTRVVFDCAARYKNTSLNDQLLSGPDLTNSIVGVLTRFRQEQVALAADIECMFHQVKVPPDDFDAFRFLWWPDDNLYADPVDYRMVVHLFGATSSPSCSSFALRQTAADNEHFFSDEAVSTVRNNFYVDDCLKSVATSEQASSLIQELTEMLAKGGFRLTKWLSNQAEVIASIPESERSSSLLDLDLDNERLPIERTLGMKWDMYSDNFIFDVQPKIKPATRRGILSVTSSIYDPLGFVSPVVLPAKKMIQDLCRQQLDWDDQIGNEDNERWNKWKEQLPDLSQLSINRCLEPASFGKVTQRELHNFADASQYAYGAVSYLRSVDESENINVSFLMGKSRLAHLRPMTIPRLELSAAVLATEMDKALRNELELDIDHSFFWTDSTSVLQYVRNTNRRFHTFVANRLTVIHENTKSFQWKYVPSEQNPADVASRGTTARALSASQWLSGPQFLSEVMASWPAEPVALAMSQCSDDDPEVKTQSQCYTTNQGTTSRDVLSELMNRYSCWNKLKRAVAWLLKFKQWIVSRKATQAAKLTVEDLQNAETSIVKLVQAQIFPDVIKVLTDSESDEAQNCVKRSLKKLSSLQQLNPFLDDKGVLRVGGRLENCNLPYDVKHQIILPTHHQVTKLVIESQHKEMGHLGEAYVLANLRQRYWIVKGKSAVRNVIGRCFLCKRINTLPAKQKMGDLPKDRLLVDEPPFTSVGVDYFGPMYVRQRRSQVKRYGCLFTCLVTRAVHIEVTESLDTDAFINAFRRFSSTRGTPKVVYSDNGTNLRAGDKELRESIELWNQDRINNSMLQKNIKWQFNPPAASHMGGVWERVIRTIRKILRALLGNQVVSHEVLITTMSEIQAILNSRPLVASSNSPQDLEALTPNHLLLLRCNPSLPPGVFDPSDNYPRRRWRQVQYLASLFWKRWLKEYLPTLQIRQKWYTSERNFVPGDLVLIVDENAKRGEWPLGKVLEANTGRDGLVRSVKVFTRGSTLTRPITKLCFLEHS